VVIARIVLAALLAVLLAAAPAGAVDRTGAVELGAAVNDHGFLHGGAVYRDTLTRYDAVTAESAMKMDVLQPERGRYAFALPDEMVAAPDPVHRTLGL